MRRVLFLIIFLLFYTNLLFSQDQLFYINKQSNVIATKDQSKTLGLYLNLDFYRHILEKSHDNFSLNIPFFDVLINFDLRKFNVYSDDVQLVSKTTSSEEEIDVDPSLLSYRLYVEGEVVGVMNFVNNKIVSSFRINNVQYEISKYKDQYVLFETLNSINTSSFSCGVQEEFNNRNLNPNLPEMRQTPITPVCVRLAVEIDYYTRQTFSSDQEAINWAYAIMAGVSQIYESQTNSAIQVVYTFVWNTMDPYAAYIAQSAAMLSELRDYWNVNNTVVSRDLVHLMTKRTNTGTGGIAYIDALCDNNWGYAYSSSLDDDTTYNFPSPSYTNNLHLCSHEIGHNFGSRHTHWCGWVADPTLPFGGGVIDNCVDVEGSCTNNPTAQLGTIMSYCNTTFSGSLLNFHPVVVSQALDIGIINATCLTTCDYYGCTDTSAFNYNPNATIDDGSCIPKIFGCTDNDPTTNGGIATNYAPLANTDDGSCTYCASLSFNNTDISCIGAGDGIIEVIVSSSSGTSFSYDWIGPNGFFTTTTTNNLSNINQEGVFNVVVTDNLGCSDTASTYIYEPSSLSVNGILTNSVSCHGFSDGTAIVDMSGGTPPYSFDFGGNNPNQLSAGNYSVSVTDSNNCPSLSSSFIIDEPLNISDNPIVNNISCNNYYDGSINLSITGGTPPFVYLWSGPNGYSSVFEDISALVDGSYSVAISDSNGCSYSNSFIITNPIALDTLLVVQNNVSCNGGNNGSILLNIIGGTPPYDYSWSNGDTSYQLTNLTEGSYNVSVNDLNGCSLPVLYFTLSEPSPSNMTEITSNVDCYGNLNGSIDITYTTSVSSIVTAFNWQGPNGFLSSQQDINSLEGGVYVLNVLEDNNCQNSFSIIVNEPDLMQVNEFVQDVSCFNGDDGIVSLDITGGVPIYFVDWNGYNPQALSAGIFLYTITDNNGCVFSDSLAVSEPLTPINVIDSTTNVSCFNGMNGTASLFILGGVPPYVESWVNSDPSHLLAGYSVYEILDFNNCLYVDSVLLSQPLPLVVNEQITDVLCNGMSTGTASIQVSGGVSPYTYLWSNADTNQLAENLSSGSYIYYVTDLNGCQNTGVVSVSENSPILVQNTIIPSTCLYTNNGSVSVIANGGVAPYSETWFGNNSSALASGLYDYLVVDANGCIDSNEVFVHSLSEVTGTPIIESVSCNSLCDGSVNLIVTNGVNPYIFQFFDSNNDSVSSNQLCAGQYSYYIIDNLGCQYLDSVLVIEPEILDLEINAQSNLLQAVASGGVFPYTFQWWNSSGLLLSSSSDLFVNQSGIYYCIVYDNNNCHSDTIQYIFENLATEDLNRFISVYPNPTNDRLFINIPVIAYNIDYVMTDVLGRRISFSNNVSDSSFEIDCSYYAKGLYLLSINIDEHTYLRKVVVE